MRRVGWEREEGTNKVLHVTVAIPAPLQQNGQKPLKQKEQRQSLHQRPASALLASVSVCNKASPMRMMHADDGQMDCTRKSRLLRSLPLRVADGWSVFDCFVVTTSIVMLGMQVCLLESVSKNTVQLFQAI